MRRRRILFLTGTRADFGKLKPLMKSVDALEGFECHIFVTGIHTMARYGYTVNEVQKTGFTNLHVFMNQIHGEPMELILANTITGLSRYVHEAPPDMMVVHGDRLEALAGAVVGSMQNILTAHVEGGEVSGTIDGVIRHSVSKMSHLHFVANDEAAIRLKQLGEKPESIFTIGSPDIDVMLSSTLPDLPSVKAHYEIDFDRYAIVAFHPVTTEAGQIARAAEELVEALLSSGRDYVVIFPNNDEGAHHIFQQYERLRHDRRFRLFPSLQFESFLTLLKHADFIIGNSSVGIREAPVYGVPSVDIGTRQLGRFSHASILNVGPEREAILGGICRAAMQGLSEPCLHFGTGESATEFSRVLQTESVWQTSRQKAFYDIPVPTRARALSGAASR